MKNWGSKEKIRNVYIGNTQVAIHGARVSDWGDPYHFVLKLSWPQFFAFIGLAFTLVNLLFGTLYWLMPGSVVNARPDAFMDYVFFSIETLATVGYGVMSPATTASHVLASVEILVGMIGVALITGLFFARFSKPTARFVFSEKMLVRDYDGSRVLMLRVANERYNRIVDASAKISIVRQEISQEGDRFFRIYDLPLVRDSTQIFALTWMLIHPIDAKSPLFGITAEQLAENPFRVLVSVTGHDEIMAAEVRAVHEYHASDLVFDGRFADVLQSTSDASRAIDMARFHTIEMPPF